MTSKRRKKKVVKLTPIDVRPHDWLLPSKGVTYLPGPLRGELGDPEQIPWIPDANLVVLYNPDITLEEFEMGLEIMKMDVKLRYSGKTEDEITTVLSGLRDLLRKRDYATLVEIIEKMKEEDSI